MAKYLDMPGLTFFYNQIKNKFASKSDVGTPLKASSTSQMTDPNRIYIYTSATDTEPNMKHGYWYYKEGNTIVEGGVYNSQALETDDTLEEAGMAADAKATGDEIRSLQDGFTALMKNELVNYSGVTTEHWGISGIGQWTSSTNQNSYTMSVPSTVMSITVTGGANGSIIAFLNSYEPVLRSSVDFSSEYPERIILAANETRIFPVKDDMNYLFTLITDTSGNNRVPTTGLLRFNTDTTLTEDNVAADARVTGEAINSLETSLSDIVETTDWASVTSTIDRETIGITLSADNNKLKMYGTANAARRMCFLNGQDETKTTSDAFSKTIDPGTYRITADATGFQTTFSIRGTYTTFSDEFTIVTSDNKSTVMTFTQPVMIGVLVVNDRNYGTSSNPTYLSVHVTTVTAKDIVARRVEKAVLYEEQNLDNEQAKQARDNIDGVGNDMLYAYNFYDVLSLGTGSSNTLRGITYTKNNDGSWTINGTASDQSWNNLVSSSGAIPRYIIPGRKYKLSFNGGSIPIRIYIYNANGSTNQTYTTDSVITFPLDMVGLIIRFNIASGTTVNNVTVKYSLIPESSTSIDNHYTYNTTVEKTENLFSNSYNITTSPQITTDSNGWLRAVDTDTTDETGKTDMTGAIMSMLNSTGYCHLGEGVFYVSGNIDMPAGSVLCGCGEKTAVRLLQTVTSGYIVSLKEYCTIRDIKFVGSPTSISPTEDGKRDAIHFTANYDGQEGSTESTTNTCMISNIWIHNFSGSGIYCHNSSISVSKGLYVTNAFILRCYAGINIDYYSEFNKFTNICTASCYIGCVNNGGNNVFTACTFHATNTGFSIDGSQPNAAHGTINGCTFCHVGSNNGLAFKANNIAAGFIIANCQIWYCGIELTDCQGVLFDGCEFGRGVSEDGSVSASIHIDGGNLVLFSGCMFHLDATRPPKITIENNSKTVFNGCYGTESGRLIEP